MAQPPLLSGNDLSVSVDGRRILSGISLELGVSEHLAVIGPNGAGKSTLLRTLAGLVLCESGTVRVNGVPMGEHSRAKLARIIAYSPQHLELLFSLSVREFVSMGRYAHGFRGTPHSANEVHIINEALDACALGALAERDMRTLSGGERQRTLISAALAQEAQIMLLDEPTSALDPKHEEEVFLLLDAVRRMRAISLITVTHDVNRAALHADRVLALREGRVHYSGSAHEVLCEEVLTPLYDVQFEFLQSSRGRIGIVRSREGI